MSDGLVGILPYGLYDESVLPQRHQFQFSLGFTGVQSSSEDSFTRNAVSPYPCHLLSLKNLSHLLGIFIKLDSEKSPKTVMEETISENHGNTYILLY